jgi:hypothetical protein
VLARFASEPRTECCCHLVAVIMAAIVAPAGARNIVMMRACFVLGRRCAFDVGFAVRPPRAFGLRPARADFLVEVLGFDWALAIGVLRGFARRHPPHHLSPAAQNRPAGLCPKARQALRSQARRALQTVEWQTGSRTWRRGATTLSVRQLSQLASHPPLMFDPADTRATSLIPRRLILPRTSFRASGKKTRHASQLIRARRV